MAGSKKSPRKPSSSSQRVATRASTATNTTIIAVEEDEHRQPQPKDEGSSRPTSASLPHPPTNGGQPPITSEDDTDAPPPPIKTHSRPAIVIAPVAPSYHPHPHASYSHSHPHPHQYGPPSYGPPGPPPRCDARYGGDVYSAAGYHHQHPSGYAAPPPGPTHGQEYAYHHPQAHQYPSYDERAAYYPPPPIPTQYHHSPALHHQSPHEGPSQQRPRRSSRSGSHRRGTTSAPQQQHQHHPHQEYPPPPPPPGGVYQHSPRDRHLPPPHAQYAPPPPPQQYHHHPPSYHSDLRLPPITPPPSQPPSGPYVYPPSHPYAHHPVQPHPSYPAESAEDNEEGEEAHGEDDEGDSQSSITASEGSPGGSGDHKKTGSKEPIGPGGEDDDDEHGNLDSLADGPEGPGSRPPYPYSTIIKYAIEGSPRGMLTLSEIYEAVERRFPFFAKKAEGQGWKNSIRHNLSLNRLFVKRPRAITEPGKGAYWMIAHGEKAGPKRVRKRKPRGKKAQAEAKAKAEAEAAAAAQLEEQNRGGDEEAAGNSHGAETPKASTSATPDVVVVTAKNGKAHGNGKHTPSSRTTPLSHDGPSKHAIEEYEDGNDEVGGGEGSRPPLKRRRVESGAGAKVRVQETRSRSPPLSASHQQDQHYADDQHQEPPQHLQQRSPRARYPAHLQRERGGRGDHNQNPPRDPFHRVVSIDGDPLMFESSREPKQHQHHHRPGTSPPLRYQPYDRSTSRNGRIGGRRPSPSGSTATASGPESGGEDDALDRTASQVSVPLMRAGEHERSLSGQSLESVTTARSSRQ
ncbi:hypothetical protein FRB96_006097 [Tulasnella sp. 330]|nr:hypothetical protein FRB96_006097 [Tulasnella sp. 330]